MSEQKKSFLIINRCAPYGSSNARDALDVALTVSVFEQPLSLLFLDDGVLQLLPNHNPADIAQKNLSANLAMLEMYDIDQIFVCEKALQQRGLTSESLGLKARTLNATEIADLVKKHDQVLSF